MKKRQAFLMLFITTFTISVSVRALSGKRVVFGSQTDEQVLTSESFVVSDVFWGLSELIESTGQDTDMFDAVGVGVVMLFSAGGSFWPGAIIGL